MEKSSPKTSRIHVFLVLGRMSNLPTIGSNILLAWAIAGGNHNNILQIVMMLLSGAALYTGGMFLNDYFDADFDQLHRKERPIPSGAISRNEVGGLGAGLMILGWIWFAYSGWISCIFGTALVGSILLYNYRHKGNPLSPWIMAACRFFLILAAASVFQSGGSVSVSVSVSVSAWPINAVVWAATAVAAYIVGLTYIAKAESAPVKKKTQFWEAILLISFPWMLCFLGFAGKGGPFQLGSAIGLVSATVWTLWTLWPVLRRSRSKAKVNVGAMVAGLLAGIPLIDCLILTPMITSGRTPDAYAALFIALFATAKISQKIAPAT